MFVRYYIGIGYVCTYLLAEQNQRNHPALQYSNNAKRRAGDAGVRQVTGQARGTARAV